MRAVVTRELRLKRHRLVESRKFLCFATHRGLYLKSMQTLPRKDRGQGRAPDPLPARVLHLQPRFVGDSDLAEQLERWRELLLQAQFRSLNSSAKTKGACAPTPARR